MNTPHLPPEIESAIRDGLQAPVPVHLVDAVHDAARRELRRRRLRRRLACFGLPAAAAALFVATLTLLPRNPGAPDAATTAGNFSDADCAQVLVALAAGGYQDETGSDKESIARGLLSLQGFALD